ncbi:anhydro-N-acetylmuramic acid kinase [Mucilaginibacter paludis]|uniref:Anhydro-N-acetylmuramic acid kinase n=1 Tax=Mucilaginibacter paludis DSM 18603 TaxID=714943 RepID=H1Y738_9SPHI|nr:anhydro-N-acetylmuramic acid kinase [Mucilaginibacter paludis]EHQ28657.1 Anhydro-N-acetylmuramic acid kinase [Mucilaginibacter paludis DSM 18603]
MNSNIEALYQIANKPEKTIIGLMSGTSFDGLDIAVCKFTGSGLQTKVRVTHFITVEYAHDFKEDLKAIFAKKQANLEQITILNEVIGAYYGDLILECLAKWGIAVADIDLIASHGQTIFHAPRHQHRLANYPNATLQIGDGDHLAVKTGIITLSDFRQKHIAAGGEGAPLAVYGDYLIFSSADESRIMLNIGGIANFTFLPSGHSTGFFSTDVGPGNTLMDQYIQLKSPGTYYDKNAEMASAGKVNEQLLSALLNHPFFKADFPKTTGPELFSLSYLQNAITNSGQGDIADVDVMATLAAFSARGIIEAIERNVLADEPFEIYLSGGGMYNPLLVKYIEKHFGRKLKSTAELGIHPDAKEAVLFALLANEAVAGGKISFGDHPGLPTVSMGKVCFPR